MAARQPSVAQRERVRRLCSAVSRGAGRSRRRRPDGLPARPPPQRAFSGSTNNGCSLSPAPAALAASVAISIWMPATFSSPPANERDSPSRMNLPGLSDNSICCSIGSTLLRRLCLIDGPSALHQSVVISRPGLSGRHILAFRVVRSRPDFHKKAARGNRLQPCQSGPLGKPNVLRHGRGRTRNPIAE